MAGWVLVKFLPFPSSHHTAVRKCSYKWAHLTFVPVQWQATAGGVGGGELTEGKIDRLEGGYPPRPAAPLQHKGFKI